MNNDNLDATIQSYFSVSGLHIVPCIEPANMKLYYNVKKFKSEWRGAIFPKFTQALKYICEMVNTGRYKEIDIAGELAGLQKDVDAIVAESQYNNREFTKNVENIEGG